MQTYTIKQGDTLGAVARRLGVPLHLLVEVNQITDPNKIRVGQVLKVPVMTTDTREIPQPVELPKPAAPAADLAINRTKFRLPPNQYVQEETEKDLVMLHFTAGSTASGAFNSWMTTEARVATAYILDLDGTVYEVFDPRFWAFHLGIKGAAAQNFRHDMRSVGIEIVNVGPLKERDGSLFWWPNDYKTRWCGLGETDKYVKAPYRGFQYYARYTEKQLAVLGPLVGHLRDRFGIHKRLPAVARRGEEDAAGFFRDFKGVASHQNYRSDKFDVGPAFDWDCLGI